MKNCEDCYYFKSFVEIGAECMHCVLDSANGEPLNEKEETEMKEYKVTTTMNVYKTYNIEAESMDEARRKGEQAFTRLCREGIGKEYGGHKINFNGLRSVTEEIKTKKPLILLCGKSGSGKTTVANLLQSKYGLKQLESYTTRPQHSDDEKGHIFMDDIRCLGQRDDGRYFMRTLTGHYWSDVPIIKDICGYKYWCTTKQLREADVYVIDPKTALELEKKVKDERNVIFVYLDVSIATSVYRMTKRGDSLEDIQKRINNEAEWHEFAYITKNTGIIIDTDTRGAEQVAESIMAFKEKCE